MNRLLLPLLLVLPAACASVREPGLPTGPDGSGLRSRSVTVQGTLTEARCYFATGAVGGDHQYCAFISMKANLPVGILTEDGEFVYLVVAPDRLAEHATRLVRIRGARVIGGQLLLPREVWVHDGSRWQEISFQVDPGHDTATER